MFTDIVNSTQLKGLMEGDTAARRDAKFRANVKEPHDKIVLTCIEEAGGHKVNPTGDGYCFTFTDAEEAILCALQIQDQLYANPIDTPLGPLQVRIGLHTGIASPTGGDYIASTMDKAARVQNKAESKQVFVSRETHALVVGKLRGVAFEKAGTFDLKGLESEDLYRAFRTGVKASGAGTPRVGRHDAPHDPDTHAVGAGRALPEKGDAPHNVFTLSWQRGALAVVGLLLILSGGVTVWQLSVRRPPLSKVVPSEKAPVLALPDKPSIAVLPFVNMSGDPEQEYFSDGMTEDLITDLSKLSGLFVIARNSVFTYKGRTVKPEQVSRELGVRYVLESSVRKVDNRVRITAQLVDATTGYHRWAKRYDRDLKDVFALQDEITQKIVAALAVQLTEGEKERLVRRYTDNLEAYDYFLRGVESYRRFTEEANAQARQMFERAINLDSKFAPAYARLGGAYWLDWAFEWNHNPQTLERAFELAQGTIALDDALPMAHTLLGQVYLWKKQHDMAIAEAERAIALDPNDAEGYGWLAHILNFAGRPEDALGLVEKAMRLDPHYPVTYLFELGHAYHLTGRYGEAIAALKRVLIRNPDHLDAHAYLAAIYSEIGRNEEALAEIKEAWKISPHASGRILPYKDPAALERYLDAWRKLRQLDTCLRHLPAVRDACMKGLLP